MVDGSGTGDSGQTKGTVSIGSRAVSIKLILGVVILVGIIFFVFQNTQEIPLRWLFLEFNMPLWGLALVLFGSGMVLGWMLHVRRLKRSKATDR